MVLLIYDGDLAKGLFLPLSTQHKCLKFKRTRRVHGTHMLPSVGRVYWFSNRLETLSSHKSMSSAFWESKHNWAKQTFIRGDSGSRSSLVQTSTEEQFGREEVRESVWNYLALTPDTTTLVPGIFVNHVGLCSLPLC